MKKVILVVSTMILAWFDAMACDACGCSIMGQPVGLLTEYRKSFLSLGYSHAGFSAAPGIGEGSVDAFQTIDLSFQYFITPRLSAGIYQPIRFNSRTIQQNQQTVSGLADTRVNMKYTFLERNDPASPFELYLDIGTGLIIPTGRYDPHIHDQDLPENFNPGYGSFAGSLYQTTAASYRSVGVVLKNSWTHFEKTSSGYRFGTQWATNLLMFAEIPVDSLLSIVPMGGLQFESVSPDHYANGTDVHGTGGKGFFLSAGAQVKIRKWLCTFQYFVPLSDQYSGGEVNAGPRINCQLTHLF